MIAQIIEAPRKPSKTLTTNKIALGFQIFLCTPTTGTLRRISLFKFGII